MKNNNTAIPFLKWAGGKQQLIKDIQKLIPNNISTYIEPFVGGGALLFHILNNYPNIKKIIINDINEILINTYKCIKLNHKELISNLEILQEEFLSKDINDRKLYYYDKRELYNKFNQNEYIQSALFIFLNRTCFNGLYRVNKDGKNNVPMGNYIKPTILNKNNIININKLLQNVEIIHGDFEDTLNYINNNENVLFYLDPPYKPLNKTSYFNSYSKDNFNDNEQVRLKNFCCKLNNLNYKWILSNSDMKNINENDNFFDDLYFGYNIHRIKARRNINSKGNKRTPIDELLITNYNIT